ncbi:hypothetical protein OTB20_08675 [Streptomyces sp. H27-H1]|uniref:hypothetical protein n=1 Tax=Streptomyces sp. H27-H1 TaxID=2996461 RepID=UPI00226DBB39|nr:hypothetical protein [Streptomyces sp. H27-H1]MCY0926280.1 hypothetical protein [Streptomyces sp. H27-H1]
MSPRIVVDPPNEAGARHVHVDAESLGMATGLRDVAEFLRRAGLELEPEEVAVFPLIEWRGGGPQAWGPETP